MHHHLLPLVACTLAGLSSASAKDLPHILFVVGDDFGWNDIGYHQNARSGANPTGAATTNGDAGVMETPVLDQLAAEGVKLESYYVQPLCSPTRSTFMTGRYPMHTGIGPDVIVAGQPYGVPARETFMPELLRDAGYDTHAIGKWHLGSCDERYEPTYRGFNSYSGYLSGAEDYFHHTGDWRNGTSPNVAPDCGVNVSDIYSTTLYMNELSRVLRTRTSTQPLFMYLAFQNVHNPYEVPPVSIIDVNVTYANVTSESRKVYGGMVTALDIAVGETVELFKTHGLWDNTLMIYTADNGGIGPGNNYPLRGMKVLDWEGGIRGVSFVRGTNSDIAKVPTNEVRNFLMHSTDWLPTLVLGVAGGSIAKTLPLDGHNQWSCITDDTPTERDFILHNIPVIAKPVVFNATAHKWTTSTCMTAVDPAAAECGTFGLIGGAVRKGDFKLVVEGQNQQGLESNNPPGIRQAPPSGFKPEGDVIPQPLNGYWLFNISADPTESVNLAATETAALADMIAFYNKWAADKDTVMDLSWRWGFTDPKSGSHPGGERCEGPFLGSKYCSFGGEFDCFVRGYSLQGTLLDKKDADSDTACQALCAATKGCLFFGLSAGECSLFSTRGEEVMCDHCVYGPAICPGL